MAHEHIKYLKKKIMFDPSSFIFMYLPTDKVLRIVDTTGKIIHTINVCRYQKSGVFGSTLSISLEDNVADYKIKFNTYNDAITALANWRQAIDSLKGNCYIETVIDPGGGDTPIAITYLTYKSLQASGDLGEMQWYDVTDTTNLLYASQSLIFRIFSKAVDDAYPQGQIIGGGYVTIDVANDKIIDYFDPINNITLLNGNLAGNSFTDTVNCYVSNNSQVNSTNSEAIIAENGSNVNCDTCSVLKATNGCNITIANASNVTFDNIQQNITSTGIVLSNVNIDRNTSIGKAGKTIYIDEGNLNLKAYKDLIDIEFNFTTNDNIIIVKIENLIHQANATFRLVLTGNTTGNKINVVDGANTLLFTMVEKDSTVVFNFNKTTLLFEFIGLIRKLVTTSQTVQFLTPTLGQTIFPISIPVTQAIECEMFINGIKQTYGVDFSFDGGNSNMLFTSPGYTIDASDSVEFRIF